MPKSKKDYQAEGEMLCNPRGKPPTTETKVIRGIVDSMATNASYMSKRDAIIAEIKRVLPKTESAGTKADIQAKALKFELPVRRRRKVTTNPASRSIGNDLESFIAQVEGLQTSLQSIRDKKSLMVAFRRDNSAAIKALKNLSFVMPGDEEETMEQGL